MNIDLPQNEMRAFYDFLGRRMDNEGGELTPEESVQEFRRYQQELERFLHETQPAIEQSDRGETRSLDVDAVMQRVTERLARQEQTG